MPTSGVDDFNSAPVSGFVGPPRRPVLQLDAHHLPRVFAKIDLNLLPLRFFDVFGERFLSVDQNDQLPVAFWVVGDLQIKGGNFFGRHLDLSVKYTGNDFAERVRQ